MGIEKYRIVEWTSTFKDGSRKLTYRLEAQSASDPVKWEPLGTSHTLDDARRALLFHVPNNGCGRS